MCVEQCRGEQPQPIDHQIDSKFGLYEITTQPLAMKQPKQNEPLQGEQCREQLGLLSRLSSTLLATSSHAADNDAAEARMIHACISPLQQKCAAVQQTLNSLHRRDDSTSELCAELRQLQQQIAQRRRLAQMRRPANSSSDSQ